MNKMLYEGFIFSAIGKYSNVIIQLIVNMILSRLLTPEEYGIVAVSQVFIVFFQMLVEAGLGPAIIQNKKLTQEDNAVLFNYNIIFSIGLAILFGFFGLVLSEVYSNSIYIQLTWIQSIFVFFTGISVVPVALITKNKKFKVVNIIRIVANLVGGVVGVFCAVYGFGIYSLVYSVTVSSILTFILTLRSSNIYLSYSLSPEPIKKVFAFASGQFGFNFINYFSRNLDNLLVGKYMGEEALGNYSKAYQLLLMPNTILLSVITPVLQPVLSDYQDDVVKIRSIYYKIIHILASIGVPLSIFLSLNAEEIIIVLFGNQWSESVFPFSILALTVWAQMTLSSSGAIYQSRNMTNQLFINGLISTTILVSSICLGVFLGDINKLSIVLSLGFVLNFFISFERVCRVALSDNLMNFLLEFKTPVWIGLFIFLELTFFKMIVTTNNVFLSLMLQGILFCIGMSFGLYVFGEHKLIINLFKERDRVK